MPLPPWLLRLLSPNAAALFDETLAPVGRWPAWRPLSLAPGETAALLVVAVGGGNVNARRIPRFLAAGAAVVVVSPALHPDLAALNAAGRITWVPREFAPADLDGAWYVLAATDAPAVNAAVVAAAEARHTFCVRADAADLGSA